MGKVEDVLYQAVTRVPFRLPKVYLLGVLDGWAQPYDLSSSYNVDVWANSGDDVHEVLDQGINLGQFLRAGMKSQSWEEFGYPKSVRRVFRKG